MRCCVFTLSAHNAIVMSGKMAALQGEAHFFEESMNPMKVKEYLSRPKVSRDSTALCCAERREKPRCKHRTNPKKYEPSAFLFQAYF